MRVDADDLERYKARAKGGNLRPAVPQPETVRLDTIRETAGVRPLVITGQDVSLDILTKHIEKRTKSYRPLRSHVGSLDSLIAMYQAKPTSSAPTCWMEIRARTTSLMSASC